MRLQKLLRTLHLWLGIASGVFIVMMSISGFVIIFRPQLEALANPRASSTGAMNLTAVEQAFRGVHADARISRVSFPMSAGDPLLVEANSRSSGRLQLFYDPVSGRELGPKRRLAWLDWITDLHQNLLLGKTGRALTAVIGIPLLVLSLTGLWSWLAGRRDWRRALAFPRTGNWQRFNYEGHRWAGLCTNLPMLVVAFTGIVLAYPSAFEAVLQKQGSERVRPREMSEAPRKLASLDGYLAAAESAIPGGIVRELRLPGRGGPAVVVTLWTSSDIRPKGGNTVTLDAATNQVVSVSRSADAPFSRKFVELANAIHKTELGGLPVKVIWSLFGFVPPVLFVSGLSIWIQRRAAARSALARRPPAEEMIAAR
jgi:uncharacterized iron-regulated membrane protein